MSLADGTGSGAIVDVLLRLAVAVLVGMAIGMNRNLKGKPT